MRPTKKQNKFLLIYFAIVVVVILILLIVAKTKNLLPDSSGPLMSWETASYFFAPMIALAVVLFFAAVLHSRKSKAKATPAPATDDEPAAGATSPSPVATTTPKKAREKSEWPIGRVVTWMVKGFVIVIIGLLMAEVIKYRYSQPSAPTRSVETATRHEYEPVRYEPVVVSPAPSSVRTVQRTLMQERAKRLLIGSREIQIPKTEEGTNDWDIKALNTSDLFIMRGEKNGKSIGSWNFGGGSGRTTRFPDADVYYIRCINRDQTYVIWTADRK